MDGRRYASVTPDPAVLFSRRHAYSSVLGFTTADGSPVAVERMGKADLAGAVREGAVEYIIDVYKLWIEELFQLTRLESKRQRRIVKAVVIIDMAGLSLR